jgi:hypothetical protein
MKKTINNTIIAIAAIAAITFMTPAAFAGPNGHVNAQTGAAVIDMQGATNAHGSGGIIGGALAGAKAKGQTNAQADASAASAMASDSYTFDLHQDGKDWKPVIGHGTGIETSGSVSAQADAKHNCNGMAASIAGGAIVQSSHSGITNNTGSANAQNLSGAAFLSFDMGNNTSAKGDAATGGYSATYSGQDGNVHFAGAQTGNFAKANGDITLAGGIGCVQSTGVQEGAYTGGQAGFNYVGNGSGSAYTESGTASYTQQGVSYKSAYSVAGAHVGPASAYGSK